MWEPFHPSHKLINVLIRNPWQNKFSDQEVQLETLFSSVDHFHGSRITAVTMVTTLHLSDQHFQQKRNDIKKQTNKKKENK